MEKIAVERVGLPGRAWLELQGTILLFHTESWLGTSSTFIPIEWVRVERGHRRDLRKLWLALIALLTAVLLALPALLLFRQPTLPAADWVLVLLLTAGMTLCLATTLAAAVRFAIPRPYVRLCISSEMREMTIDFWQPRRTSGLENVLAQIHNTQAHGDAGISFPIRMNHAWRRPRPLRLALLRGGLISAILYVPLVTWDFAASQGGVTPFPRLLYLILLAPPVVQVLSVLLRRALWEEPRSYRRAVSAYLRQDEAAAEKLLRETLAANRDHGPSLLLLIQLLTEQGRFDEAATYCDRLALEHPLLASRLQASLWGVKRLHARMHGK